MRQSVIGQVLLIILTVLNCIVMPIFNIGNHIWDATQHQMVTDTRNFIDEVIDTREITDVMMEDYNLRIAAKSSYYTVDIYREVRVINPDPANPGKTKTNYLMVEDNRHYNQGDLITVRVETVGLNLFQTISRSMLGISAYSDVIQHTGRVR